MLYEKFLERLKEMSWSGYHGSPYEVRFDEERKLQNTVVYPGVREGESALEAIARNMEEVVNEYHASMRAVPRDIVPIQNNRDGVTGYIDG